MDIQNFIEQTLSQITKSVNNNTSGDNIKYAVNYNSGVDFDLAVTTIDSSSDSSEVAGGFKLKIVGANASKESSSQISQQTVSRIKFNVEFNDENISMIC